MTNLTNKETFDDLSEKYSIWIIKYYSATFKKPLFLVWYTDINENYTDKLLTYKSGEIFGTISLTNLKTTILSSRDELIKFENLNSWLDDFTNLEVKEYCVYDLISIKDNISKNNFESETIEGFTNFINLYEDFVNQNKNNNHLQVYADNLLVREVWDYFYDYNFWNSNRKEEFKQLQNPKLEIDTKRLLENLNQLIKVFDAKIKIIEAIC